MQEPASMTSDGLAARLTPDEQERAKRASYSIRMSKALFLFAAGISFLLSVYLWFLGDREQGLFVGLWVPSILSLGALLLGGKGRLS
jgi:Na+/melibiose symporter-like transporter